MVHTRPFFAMLLETLLGNRPCNLHGFTTTQSSIAQRNQKHVLDAHYTLPTAATAGAFGFSGGKRCLSCSSVRPVGT
eukprot:8642082-Alexandrium_andersonii.AAC.1